MRSDLPTMAEQFAAAGYRTVSVASNRFLDPKLGLTRGFEVAETIPDRELAERIGAVLKEDDDRPLLMFVNILIAHAPWEVFPASWSKPYGERLSAAEKAPAWAEGYLMDAREDWTSIGCVTARTAAGSGAHRGRHQHSSRRHAHH